MSEILKLGQFEIDNVYCVDSYKAIKELPDKSVDCIYTDVPYFLPNTPSASGGFMHERVNRISKSELKDFRNGIDYSILDDFVRVCKTLNIFIWCNKFMIKDLLDYFIDRGGARNTKLWYGRKTTQYQ